MAGRFVVDGDGMTAEEFLLHGKRVRFERRRFGARSALALALFGLQHGFDIGEIFAGGLGVARELPAENGFNRAR